jgi:CheY-like chemotaxis protein
MSARALEIIERQVQRMTRLVNDLLDVSRVTHGKLRLQEEMTSLRGIVEGAIELQRPHIADRQQNLTIDLPASDIWLLGDPARLEQVLSNLLHNASKCTQPNGHIWLKAFQSSDELLISVRDDGIGLLPDARDQLFDVFVQGASAGSREGGGLGIGLTLVRAIVRMHGGAVEVKSEGAGKGSEFLIRLPIRSTLHIHQHPQMNGSAHAGPARRFLVVDDNIDAADALAEALRLAGHHVVVAYDGEAAILEAARIRPDVIVLDIGMPGMNGYDVATQLQSMPGLESAHRIAVTGFGQREDRERSRAAGFHHHLVKPVGIRELEHVLGEAGRQPA